MRQALFQIKYFLQHELYLPYYTLIRCTLSNPIALAPAKADFPKGNALAKALFTELQFDFCICLDSLAPERGMFLEMG